MTKREKGSHFSEELKTQVLAYIDEGHSRLEACEKFNVSPSNVSAWKAKRKKLGSRASKEKADSYQKIEVPEDQKKSKIAVIISDDANSIIEVLRGL